MNWWATATPDGFTARAAEIARGLVPRPATTEPEPRRRTAATPAASPRPPRSPRQPGPRVDTRPRKTSPRVGVIAPSTAVERVRRWQAKQIAAGRCRTCGGVRPCTRCRLKAQQYRRTYYLAHQEREKQRSAAYKAARKAQR